MKALPDGMQEDLANVRPRQEVVVRLVQNADGQFYCACDGGIVDNDGTLKRLRKSDQYAIVLGWLQAVMTEMQQEIAPDENRPKILVARGLVGRA